MRLAPIPPNDIRPDQQALFDEFSKRVSGKYQTFTTTRSDGALLGPWAVWLTVPKTGEAIRNFITTVETMPGLEPTSVQAVILTTGAHFNCAYEMYAHAAVGKAAGLTDEQIASLSAGTNPPSLDAEGRLAVETAQALLRGGVLPGPLFRRAVAELGQDGFDHLIYTVSQYCLVSISLNAYDVPSEDEADHS